MKYLMNDIHLEISHTFSDHSINILNFEELGASLVMTRKKLQKNQSLEAFIESQLKELKNNMSNFVIGEQTEIKIGNHHDLLATEIYCGFNKEGRKVNQILLIIRKELSLFVLTYSQLRPFKEKDLDHWQHIKTSFQIKNP